MKSNIFIVTAVKVNHVKGGLRAKETKQHFHTFDEAEQYILKGDLFEGGKYENAIIEVVIGSFVDEKIWYEALFSYLDWELYKVQKCPKPKLKHK